MKILRLHDSENCPLHVVVDKIVVFGPVAKTRERPACTAIRLVCGDHLNVKETVEDLLTMLSDSGFESKGLEDYDFNPEPGP